MTTPATKIVIVAGQEFAVPAETDNEAIRQQLLTMGFADVASATIQKGTRDGTETIEFVKKAGTKGLDGAELAGLLAGLPPGPLTLPPSTSAAGLLERLVTERLTVGEALANERIIHHALGELAGGWTPQKEGAALCDRVDRVPAAPCATPLGW